MATVKKESIGTLHEKLVIIFENEDYAPKFETKLKERSRNTSIPGFRKGHVPKSMLRKRIGPEIFFDEINRMAREKLLNFMEEEGPGSLLGYPIALPSEQKLDMDMKEAIRLEYEIGRRPEINIDYDQLRSEATFYRIQITDEMLDTETENLRMKAGKSEEVEQVQTDADIVHFELHQDGQDPSEEQKPQVEELRALPESLAKKIKQAKVGESVTFRLSEMSEEEKESFRKTFLKDQENIQEDADYRLTLTKILHTQPSELNAEFFKTVFPQSEIETAEEFRQELKKAFEAETEQYSVHRFENDLFELLVHKTPMELPTDFLKRWMRDSEEKVMSDEEAEAKYPGFEHQLRWTLISEHLLEKYDIAVSLEEVKDDFRRRTLQYFGIDNAADAPWIESYLENVVKNQKTTDETYRRLLFNKLFAKLRELLDVPVKEVSQEEFINLPTAHHH